MIKYRLCSGGCKLLYWSDGLTLWEKVFLLYLLVLDSYLRIPFFLFISIANFASHLSCFIVLIGNETGKSNVSLTFRKKDLKAFAVLRHPCVLYLLIVSGVSFRWEWLKIHVFLLFPYKRIKLLVLVGFSLSLEYPNSVWGCA